MTLETESYVQFPVPTDRVADVARFLFGADIAMPDAVEAASEPIEMSAEQREELLRRAYVESEPTFRRLLMLLAGRPEPDEPMYFADVSEAMGWTSPRQLPGALGAYGRRAKHRYGGFWPFVSDWDVSAWSYFLVMDPADATFLRNLHAERALPTE